MKRKRDQRPLKQQQHHHQTLLSVYFKIRPEAIPRANTHVINLEIQQLNEQLQKAENIIIELREDYAIAEDELYRIEKKYRIKKKALADTHVCEKCKDTVMSCQICHKHFHFGDCGLAECETCYTTRCDDCSTYANNGEGACRAYNCYPYPSSSSDEEED